MIRSNSETPSINVMRHLTFILESEMSILTTLYLKNIFNTHKYIVYKGIERKHNKENTLLFEFYTIIIL